MVAIAHTGRVTEFTSEVVVTSYIYASGYFISQGAAPAGYLPHRLGAAIASLIGLSHVKSRVFTLVENALYPVRPKCSAISMRRSSTKRRNHF
jgi:hypothetical protein